MLVREVMSTPVVTVQADTSVKGALTLLAEHSITSLPVVGQDGQVIGVVSEADLIRDGIPQDLRLHLNFAPAPQSGDLPAQTVGELMSHHPVTVSPDTDLRQATELMTSTTVKSLPVVDDQHRVVGVVSRRDVVRVLAQPDDRLGAEAGELLRQLGQDWLVEVTGGVASVTGPRTAKECAMATAVISSIPGVTGVTID